MRVRTVHFLSKHKPTHRSFKLVKFEPSTVFLKINVHIIKQKSYLKIVFYLIYRNVDIVTIDIIYYEYYTVMVQLH